MCVPLATVRAHHAGLARQSSRSRDYGLRRLQHKIESLEATLQLLREMGETNTASVEAELAQMRCGFPTFRRTLGCSLLFTGLLGSFRSARADDSVVLIVYQKIFSVDCPPPAPISQMLLTG